MDPIPPAHRVCASCFYWTPGGDNPEWCHANMGYTGPAFSCEDYRDCRDRTDPETGEKWEALGPAPIKEIKC